MTMRSATPPSAPPPSAPPPSGPLPNDIADRPYRSGHVRCPHCDCVGLRRSSRAVTPQHRQIYYQCSNVLCGHTWLATLSYEYGIVPSAIPDPRVVLPLRPMPRQQVLELLREADPDQPDLFPAQGGDDGAADAAPPGADTS